MPASGIVGLSKRIAVGALGLGAVLVVPFSIGPSSLPTDTTVLLRAHVGRHLAWPFEALVERPYALRSIEASADARLEQLVARAREQLEWLHPDPAEPGRYPPVAVLRLTGTYYEMGYVYGRVLQQEIRDNVTRRMMPEVRRMAWPRQLNRAWSAVEPFVPRPYLDELRGLADGSGLKLELLEQLHAVPEISEQMCSGYALDESITADGYDYHVRVLDYATGLGVQAHPVVVFHRPLDEAHRPIDHAYVNVTWAGFDWSVGGVNEHGLAIGEIGGGNADAVEGERAEGEPMGVLVRRTLNQSADLPQAESTIESATRNLRYVYVMSDPAASSRVLAGPSFFRVTGEGEPLESLGPGYEALPGFPGLTWHGANHETHIARFSERHLGLGFDDLVEHAQAVALRKNLHAWILRRGDCDTGGCGTLDLWLFNAVGERDRAVDQPPVRIDLARHFAALRSSAP